MRSSLAEPPLVSPYNPSAYYVYYNPYYYTSLCVCVCVLLFPSVCVCLPPPPLHPFPSSPGGGRKRVQKQEMRERKEKNLKTGRRERRNAQYSAWFGCGKIPRLLVDGERQTLHLLLC
jgi:hypothetical protein